MPAEPDRLIQRLAVGDAAAVADLVERARVTDDVPTIVAAALCSTAADDLMTRAATTARTTRDRQIVAIAAAHLAGDGPRVNDLARDHLVDHPDSVLVAWIAAVTNQPAPTREVP